MKVVLWRRMSRLQQMLTQLVQYVLETKCLLSACVTSHTTDCLELLLMRLMVPGAMNLLSNIVAQRYKKSQCRFSYLRVCARTQTHHRENTGNIFYLQLCYVCTTKFGQYWGNHPATVKHSKIEQPRRCQGLLQVWWGMVKIKLSSTAT